MLPTVAVNYHGCSDVSIEYVHIDEETGLNTVEIKHIINAELEREDRRAAINL